MDRITPEHVIRLHVEGRGISVPEIGVAPTVLIVWSMRAFSIATAALAAERAPHWLYGDRNPLHRGTHEHAPISVLLAPVGAAGTVMMMEELIAAGARRIIGFGAAGSLQPSAPIGSLLIPTECTAEEGTSPHYQDRGQIAPDSALHQSLIDAANSIGVDYNAGPHWTTDAPYREGIDKIDRLRRVGVVGVDMETSAMFACGRFRQVEVANLLVVTDEVWREWNPAFGSPEVAAGWERGLRVVLRSAVASVSP